MRARFAVFIAIVQSILFLGHLIIYGTWIELWGADSETKLTLGIVVAVLSVTFVTSSALGFRYSNAGVRAFYRLAATWIGFLNFLFCASLLSWAVFALCWVVGWHGAGRPIVGFFYGAAAAISVYGILNAAHTRVRRISVKMPNLPAWWRGRTAALVSDLHLGHVRSFGFVRRIVATLVALAPDVVFIAGDLYDGVAVDVEGLAGEWSELKTPLGVFFVAGNHEEFGSPAKYFDAVRRAGVHVLNNEMVSADGLQIVGVDYRASVSSKYFTSVLEKARIDPNRASILVSHAPHHLEIPEGAGISLQVSGHTHHGQLIPFTWMVDRIFGPYAYGLHPFGKMMVYTSCGAGTWGPPMRVGTDPEIVMITFE